MWDGPSIPTCLELTLSMNSVNLYSCFFSFLVCSLHYSPLVFTMNHRLLLNQTHGWPVFIISPPSTYGYVPSHRGTPPSPLLFLLKWHHFCVDHWFPPCLATNPYQLTILHPVSWNPLWLTNVSGGPHLPPRHSLSKNAKGSRCRIFRSYGEGGLVERWWWQRRMVAGHGG